eukprot:COSAG06_NODE_16471_length_986_cov_1.225556_1_plen_80_part_10
MPRDVLHAQRWPYPDQPVVGATTDVPPLDRESDYNFDVQGWLHLPNVLSAAEQRELLAAGDGGDGGVEEAVAALVRHPVL